jgi:chromosomal replication initiation ATPase DnaA
MTPRQLSFDLPPNVALGPDDYFVSEANAHAYVMVTNPDGWADGKLALIGPKGSGKSHLSRVFQHLTGATVWKAGDIGATLDLPSCPIVVEDMEALSPQSEEPLFHLHNHLRAQRLPLLLTATTPPSRWSIALPDLASRMQAAPTVHIADPDDRLLSAVLMKHFADRQLTPKPALISYLAGRIERSFSAADDIVSALDKEALATGQPIGIKLAGRLLDNPSE